MDTRHHEYKHSATAPHHYLYFEEELKKHGPEALDPAKGYYSYELDGWQIIVLNSNLCADKKVRNRYGNGCTEQLQWLEMELANIEEGSCTLAYFHHPAFTSGGKPEKEKRAMCPIFKKLYDHRVELALAGHEHSYERFRPLAIVGPDGNLQAEERPDGVVQIVAGTGGKELRSFKKMDLGSEKRGFKKENAYGVLKVVLEPESYLFEFIAITGSDFRDTGGGKCH